MWETRRRTSSLATQDGQCKRSESQTEDANTDNHSFDIKRLIGRRYQDKDVQQDIKHFPFKVVNKDGQPRVQVEVKGEDKTFTPEEISAMVLGKMKEVAESYLGETVGRTVLSDTEYTG